MASYSRTMSIWKNISIIFVMVFVTFFFPLMEMWIPKNLFSWKDNNTMLLIACRKVHFKTGKLKFHEKVILPIFLLLCFLSKPLVMAIIKWSQQGSTILNLPGMYNVRSTLVLGGYVGTGKRSSF